MVFLKGLQTKMAKSILEFPSHSIDYNLLAEAIYNILKEFWIWKEMDLEFFDLVRLLSEK